MLERLQDFSTIFFGLMTNVIDAWYKLPQRSWQRRVWKLNATSTYLSLKSSHINQQTIRVFQASKWKQMAFSQGFCTQDMIMKMSQHEKDSWPISWRVWHLVYHLWWDEFSHFADHRRWENLWQMSYSISSAIQFLRIHNLGHQFLWMLKTR